jgi:exosortase
VTCIDPGRCSPLIAMHTRLRIISFAGFVLASVLVFWRSLSMLIEYSLEHEFCSHILLIAPLSLSLLYRERTKIFARLNSSFMAGSILLFAGIIGYGLSRHWWPVLGQNDGLTVSVLSIVMIWFGGFFLFFGARAFQKALFPMLFLLLMAPLPDALLSHAIHALQVGSTKLSFWLFQLVGVPVLQEGFVLRMPTLSIEVAKECSSIRSSLALFITSLLAAHLFLRSIGNKAALVAVAVPLAMLKNGIRIVTLSLLSIYVDRGFLTGRLHHEGGILFFLLDCMILIGLLRLFQMWEYRRERMHLAGVEQ